MELLKLSPEAGGYRFLEHITDAEIEAYGQTLEEAFQNAAKALEDTMVDIKTISQAREEQIKVKGKDKQQLLYQWLESLISKQDTEGMLYSKFICKISRQNDYLLLNARASGEKFDPKRHEQKTAIKAPTYHGMAIDEKNSEKFPVMLRFLLDL